MAKKKQTLEVKEKLMQKPVGQVSEEAYLSYGYYVNCHRHMVNLDGCKDVYRRLIYASTLYAKDSHVPTVDLLGKVALTHPHGTASLDATAAMLVRSGVFSGKGSFGYMGIDGTDNPNAAPRYTQTWLSDTYREILGQLIKEVPYVDSPVGAPEPTYLPVVLPLCLYMSNTVMGLGVAIASKYPNFSPQSLYKAYVNDDPSLLEPRVKLLLDKKHSELDKLWNTGIGRVTYAYKLSRQTINDVDGILFEGDTGLFVPNLKKLKKLQEEGQVFVDDMTDINGPKLFVGRLPGSKKINILQVEKICQEICSSSTIYTLNVTDGKSAFRIPLKDWIGYTIENYIELVTKVNKKNINQVNFQIAVQQALPIISDYIINKNPKATDEEISNTLGVSMEIVKEVVSKPISWLRKNKDTNERVKMLKAKLKELKSFNAVSYTEQIINKL